MINMFPDSTLIPRAKQKLRDVQEVLAERETQIGLYYQGRENYTASIARLQTVVDTYPALLQERPGTARASAIPIAGEAHAVQMAPERARCSSRTTARHVSGRGGRSVRQGDYAVSDGAPR